MHKSKESSGFIPVCILVHSQQLQEETLWVFSPARINQSVFQLSFLSQSRKTGRIRIGIALFISLYLNSAVLWICTCNKVGYDVSTPSQTKPYRTERTKKSTKGEKKKGMRHTVKKKTGMLKEKQISHSDQIKWVKKRKGKHKRGQIEHIHHHHAEKSWMSDMQTANTRTQPWAGRSPRCLKKLIGKVIYLHHMVQVFWPVCTHNKI